MSCSKSVTILAATGLAFIFLSSCSVRPLYSPVQGQGTGRIQAHQPPALYARLAAITVDASADRNGQILRNRLIYLLGNGQVPANTGDYQLTLDIAVAVSAAAQLDVGDRTDRTGRPSAGTIRAQAGYVLRSNDGAVLAQRRRSVSVPFDRPRQEYANLQAEEDAKKRAIEELAQQIYLSLAQDLS